MRQHAHWEFSILRHAQHSTMRILNHIHNKPSYCIDNCKHGGVEDGHSWWAATTVTGGITASALASPKRKRAIWNVTYAHAAETSLPSGDAVAGATV